MGTRGRITARPGDRARHRCLSTGWMRCWECGRSVAGLTLHLKDWNDLCCISCSAVHEGLRQSCCDAGDPSCRDSAVSGRRGMDNSYSQQSDGDGGGASTGGGTGPQLPQSDTRGHPHSGVPGTERGRTSTDNGSTRAAAGAAGDSPPSGAGEASGATLDAMTGPELAALLASLCVRHSVVLHTTFVACLERLASLDRQSSLCLLSCLGERRAAIRARRPCFCCNVAIATHAADADVIVRMLLACRGGGGHPRLDVPWASVRLGALCSHAGQATTPTGRLRIPHARGPALATRLRARPSPMHALRPPGEPFIPTQAVASPSSASLTDPVFHAVSHLQCRTRSARRNTMPLPPPAGARGGPARPPAACRSRGPTGPRQVRGAGHGHRAPPAPVRGRGGGDVAAAVRPGHGGLPRRGHAWRRGRGRGELRVRFE